MIVDAEVLRRARNPEALLLRVHTERAPHWSEGIEWRAGRWDPISTAPSSGSPILNIRIREADGRIVEPVHFAQDLSGECMPAFSGWYVPVLRADGTTSYFAPVDPVEWQPLRATP